MEDRHPSPPDLHGHPLPPPPPKRPCDGRCRSEPRPPKRDKAGDQRAARAFAYMDRNAPEAHPAEIAFRHSGWKTKREKVLAALHAGGINATQVWNFQQCGSECISEWSESLQRRRLRAHYCKSRHCEPCARSKANKAARNLRAKLEGAARHQFRFITLTIKHSDRPLFEQIAKLYKDFRKLRQTKEWKQSQKGGAVILEVKHTGKHWHPHLHICAEGRFLKKARLSELWHKATGDSFIVKIIDIDRGTDLAAYLCKYITKSTDASVWSHPDRASEWIHASKGVRTANTFGTWRKYPLLASGHKATDWTRENKLTTLIWLAREGHQVSYDIIASLLSLRGHQDADVPPEQLPVADEGSEWKMTPPSG